MRDERCSASLFILDFRDGGVGRIAAGGVDVGSSLPVYVVFPTEIRWPIGIVLLAAELDTISQRCVRREDPQFWKEPDRAPRLLPGIEGELFVNRACILRGDARVERE